MWFPGLNRSYQPDVREISGEAWKGLRSGESERDDRALLSSGRRRDELIDSACGVRDRTDFDDLDPNDVNNAIQASKHEDVRRFVLQRVRSTRRE